jgi:hypothetical protein
MEAANATRGCSAMLMLYNVSAIEYEVKEGYCPELLQARMGCHSGHVIDGHQPPATGHQPPASSQRMITLEARTTVLENTGLMILKG